MSSTEEYEQQSYWQQNNDYTWINLSPDEWKKFQESNEKMFKDELIFGRSAMHFPDFERVDPRDPKLWNNIQNLTLEEVMERYPLTVEQVNALKEKQNGTI